MMAGIKGKNTQPELLVRRYLHRLGFRYRLNVRSLPGSPDIVFPKRKTVIFVHGCFWHRHLGCGYCSTPATNRERWLSKFSENIERDQRKIEALIVTGWRVIIIWECALRDVKKGKASLDWLQKALLSPDWGPILEWPSN
jgi:DNA mismatch endonuclease (patch repair protein)